MNRAATLPDVDQVEGRGGGGTAVPGGRSVWDLETTVPGAATAPPASSSHPSPTSTPTPAPPPPTSCDPAELEFHEEEASARRVAPPVEPEIVRQSDEPESPASSPAEDDRRRNRIGLVGVLFVVGLVIAVGVWILGADADSARPSSQPTAATLPSAEGNLDALADFTERSAPAEETNEQPELVVDEPGVVAAEAPASDPGPIEGAASSEPAPAELASVEPEPVEPASVDLPEPVAPIEPVEPEPAVDNAEVGAVAPVAEPGPSATSQEGPRVEITTRVEPCRFGSSCLVAGFVMHGFDTTPQEFICEFASGSRFTFRATSQTVDHACATGSSGDSITIEIAGVRSATVVHE